MTEREVIIGAARKYGVDIDGLEHPDRDSIGVQSIVSSSSYGWWVGASAFVSRGDVEKFTKANTRKRDKQ